MRETMKSSLKKLKNEETNLGHFLKTTRLSHNFTQRKVAEELNLTPQFLSNIELSKCSPPPYILKRMVTYYKIRPQKIIKILLNEEQRRLKQLFFVD